VEFGPKKTSSKTVDEKGRRLPRVPIAIGEAASSQRSTPVLQAGGNMGDVWKKGLVVHVAVALVSGAVAFGLITAASVHGQGGSRPSREQRDQERRLRFSNNGSVEDEDNAAAPATRTSEAASGFDNLTNGFDPQGPDYESLNEDNVVPLRSFNDNRFIFEEVEEIADGLGPTYNAQSCRECHQNVVTGGASQITEHRTGRLTDGQFFESQGGTLIQSRTTHPDAGELVAFEDDIRTFRISTNTLGAGYVEAIANATLKRIRDQQPAEMRGTTLEVPILEADSHPRFGRFGWKDQHGSLESFAADAYLNEMGITSPLFPQENTSGGRDVSQYDMVPDPEDDGVDVKAFANFMRSTKAPSRGSITPAVQAGEQLFTQTGCAVCHVTSIATARPGTVINGGALKVSESLGSKVIHPYSDFFLHDIGTGDGIPVQPTPEFAGTANQIRTAPLWGLRTRSRLMHDGLTFTRQEAIRRHAGQAAAVVQRFNGLTAGQQAALIAFLNSL
jgi:CxxC motif-containing protein (DUF1111 family)